MELANFPRVPRACAYKRTLRLSQNYDELTLVGVRVEPGRRSRPSRPGSAVAVPPALSVSPPTPAGSPTTPRVRE